MTPVFVRCTRRRLDLPDWRWREAVEIVEGRRSTGCCDDLIQTAVWYIRAAQAEAAGGFPTSLVSEDMAIACALYTDWWWAGDEVEARVLAGQPIRIISHLTGVPVHIIRLYERLFFDVRHRLADRRWIMDMVVGRCHWTTRPPTQREEWCFTAITAGFEVLNAQIAQDRLPPCCSWTRRGRRRIDLLAQASRLRARRYARHAAARRSAQRAHSSRHLRH